jgi:hypothetical protein
MKRYFLTLFVLLSAVFALSGREKPAAVAVVVDRVTYQAIGADVDAFVKSMESVGKRGVLVVDRWAQPDSIRAELRRLYEKEGLEGAVLVGNIPIPMIRDAHHLTTAFKMNPKQPWAKSSVPSDRLYDDFDLRFDYLRQDADHPQLHYYSLRADSPQVIHCDIWTSRIKPPQVPGVTATEAIAQYLRKAVQAKAASRTPIRHVLHFAGRSYNSDAFQARIDERWALQEQFPRLGAEHGTGIDFVNFNHDKVVRTRLMQLLALDRYDLAILHHHGEPDEQLLSGASPASMPKELLGAAQTYFRSKIRDARDPEATKQRYMQEYNLPESFFADSPELAAADSTYYAEMNLYIPDLHGYTSNARVILLDACFNGSFNNDDYIAGYYLFNPGGTMVVKANTVNTLQDTWTNELLGLLDAGVAVGNWAKGQLTLESHLLGDASWRFANQATKQDIDRTITARRKDSRTWRKLLGCGVTDIETLAIKQLNENGAITPQELLTIERDNPKAVLRLEAFMALKRRADGNLTEAIRLGLEDDYELLQRLAALTAAVNGDPALAPDVERLLADPAITQRVEFQLKGGKEAWFPTERILKEYQALTDPDIPLKQKRSTISAQRNACNPFCVEPMIAWFKACDDVQMRTDIAETLGWYRYSYKKTEILAACRELLVTEQEPVVQNELRKTIQRLTDL